MPTRSSWAPAKIRGPHFSTDFTQRLRKARVSARRFARWPVCRSDSPRSDQAAVCISSRTRSSSRAAARTSATSATRRRSSRAADPFTRRPSTRRSPRSNDCPAAICTFSTITCSAIAASRRRSSTACAAWDGSGRRPARSTRCSRPICSNARWPAGLAQPVRRLRDAEPGQSGASSTSTRTCSRDYAAAIRRLHDLGVMINGSFVFGMDDDDGIGVRAHRGVGDRAGHRDRDVPHPHAVPGHGALPAHGGAEPSHHRRLGSLRHAPRRLPAGAHDGRRSSNDGYHWAYREFYRWRSIARGAAAHDDLVAGLRHFGYCGGVEEVRAAVGLRHSREARRA